MALSQEAKAPGIISGTIFGLLVAPIFYAAVFVLELANCLLCGLPTLMCNLDRFYQNTLNSIFGCGCHDGQFACIPIWSGGIFWTTFGVSLGACVIIGIIYDITTHKQRYQQREWIKKLKELAEQGNPQAQFELGQLYADSKNVDDLKTAFELFEKAAAQGHPEAIQTIKAEEERKEREAEEEKREQARKAEEYRKIQESRITKASELCSTCRQLSFRHPELFGVSHITLGDAIGRGVPPVTNSMIIGTFMKHANQWHCTSCWGMVQERYKRFRE